MRPVKLTIVNNSRITAALGLAAFVLFVVSQMISSTVETSKLFTLIRVAVITVSILCYLACYYSSELIDDYKRQISWINICVLGYHLLYCIVAFRFAVYIRYYSQIYMEIAWLLAGLLVLWNSRRILALSLAAIKKKDTLFWVIVAGIFALIVVALSYDVDGPHVVWDARSLFEDLSDLDLVDIFNIRKFFIFAHLAVSYFYSIFLLGGLTGSLLWGYWIYNAACLVIVSYSVVFILKKTLADKSRLYIALASAACLFSPFVCGISTHYTYDFALCCLTPLLVLFAINEDWIYFIFVSIYISLVKEPGIIIVAAVCAGIILMELICDKTSIRKSLFRLRTVCELFVAALFIVFFKVYSFYEDTVEAGYGFDKGHTIAVLKYFLVMNYEWAVILFAVILVVAAIVMKKKPVGYTIVYLLPAVSLLVFYIIFICEEYVRYTEAFPVCILLIVVSLLAALDLKEYIQDILVSALVVLMLASSFFSFDPVSSRFMITENIGNSDLYFARQGFDFGGDPHVYNRQYYGLDIVFDEALRKAIASGDDLIAVSNGNNRRTWAMDGGTYAYDEKDGKRVFTEFWNVKRDTRDPVYKYDYYSDPDHIQLDLHFIFPDDDIVASLGEGESFIYIYMPAQNGGREDIVRDHFKVVEEGSFTSHGWVLSYIRGVKR